MTRAITKQFGSSFKGLSLASNDFTRSLPFTKTFDNLILNDRAEFQKRNGFKIATNHFDGTGAGEEVCDGLTSHIKTELDGSQTTEVLVWAEDPADNKYKLARLKTATITITYSGAGALAGFAWYVDASVWEAVLEVDGSAVSGWPKNYGTGLEASPTGMSQLISDLDGEADFAASDDGSDTDVPAAALNIVALTTFASTTTITYEYAEYIGTGESFTEAYLQEFDASNYTSPSAAKVGGSVFFARDQQDAEVQTYNTTNTAQYTYKYDGNKCYRAGLFQPSGISLLNGSDGTALLAGVYQYRLRLIRYDALGTATYSKYSDAVSITVTDGGSGGRASVTVAPTSNIGSTQYTDFGLHSARADGAQTSTTITVDAGHNLEADDYITVPSTLNSARVRVVSVTGTVITVDQSITVADNEIMSNVYCEYYRTILGGNLFYLVTTDIPVWRDLTVASSPVDISDTTTDANLVANALLLEDSIERDLPPAARFSTAHQGLLILAGVPGRLQEVFVSDLEGPEYIPDTSTISVANSGPGRITGIGSDGERLYIFKERSYSIVHGNLRTVDPGQPPDIFVEEKDFGIGCVAHDTIKLGEEGLYFLSMKGPQRFVEGSLDANFSSRLAPYYKDLVDSGGRLVGTVSGSYTAKSFLRHGKAVYDPLRKMYCLCVALETGTVDTYRYSSSVKWFVYEELQENDIGDVWYRWTASGFVNWSGICGMAVVDDTIYSAGIHSHTANQSRSYICKEIRRTDLYRLADNISAIDAKYHTPWEAMANPSVFKQLKRIRVWRARDSNSIGGTYTVRAYKDFVDESDTSQAYSTLSLDMSTTTTIEKRDKFKMPKLSAFLVELQNAVIYEDMRVSGIELGVMADYKGGEIEAKA